MLASYRVGGKRVAVELGPNITTATGVLVVVPGAAYACTLFKNDKVVAFVSLHEVDGCAHAGYTCTYDDYGSIGVVFVAHWHLGPWLGASHVG